MGGLEGEWPLAPVWLSRLRPCFSAEVPANYFCDPSTLGGWGVAYRCTSDRRDGSWRGLEGTPPLWGD